MPPLEDMSEPRRDLQYSIEFGDASGRKPLLPDVRASEYLQQWLVDLKSGKLDWFAAKPKPNRLFGGVNVTPSYGNGTDLIVEIPAVHPNVGAAIMPEVGVSHCGKSSPLHGEVTLLLPRVADIDRQDIRDVLSALKATPTFDTKEAYQTTRPLILKSLVAYDPLQTVYVGKDDLLEALGLPEKDQFIGIFDPSMRRTTVAAVYLLRQQGIFFAAGQSLFSYDEYNSESDSESLRQGLRTSLRQNGLDGKDLSGQLSTYHQDHPEVEEMFAGYPDMEVEVNLGLQMHRISTDTIINFAEFQEMIAKFVPEANIPRIPPNAQRLGQIDDIPNMTLISPSEQRLGLYLARSSGICRNHYTD
jgi:hypothetical protein